MTRETEENSYPCVAEVMQATAPQLEYWREHLPAAQSDVQRTVHRRIHARLEMLAGRPVQEKEKPGDLNLLMEQLERVTGRPHPRL